MTIDHDSVMVAHARRRGPVTVSREGEPTRTGLLYAWRPHDKRPNEHGTLRRTYSARIIFDGHDSPRRVNLKHYQVEPA